MNATVAVIMGSDSDLPKMQRGIDLLSEFNIKTEVKIVSAHRTPEMMIRFAKNAHKKGIKVIIAAAGGAAHLPGMVASVTPLPVIGVPISVTKLDGMDALLSIAQMPAGVPVATMAVDNSANAALMAARILGVKSKVTFNKVVDYQKKLKVKVDNMNKKLKKNKKKK